MYASASTWLFNVARLVIQEAQPEQVQTAFVSGKEKSLNFGPSTEVQLFKSHEVAAENHIVDLSKHSCKILITIRDPRDAVASLMQAHGNGFVKALDLVEQSALLCKSFVKDRRAKLFEYETRFFEDPTTVATVAEYLGYKLEPDVARTIYKALTRGEVEKHIRKMPKLPGVLVSRDGGDLLDTSTQWHSHHAGRDGEIGKWRHLLDTQQVRQIERRIGHHFPLLKAS